MKFGCIGEHLPHSFSREIHEKLGGYEYILKEIPRGGLDSFMTALDFEGINVTIPYKQDVIPYCDEVEENARRIGAVNTIVNRGGKLCGYNTDFGGLKSLINRAGIDVNCKKVLILGTGGTSRTAVAVCESLGASEIYRVSRSGRDCAVTYDDAYKYHSDASVIINTTPSGMYPHPNETPISLDRFTKLSGVVDVVYNPLRTQLVSEAKALGIPAESGLYMLVEQAVLAARHFTGNDYDDSVTEQVFCELLSQKENIVLIGMPGCGKTTVGRRLAEITGRRYIDTDEEIVKASGMSIKEIFGKYGEEHFRRLETESVKASGLVGNAVISTGGGVVLRAENINELKRNGRLYFIDRPLELLIPTDDRPLGSTVEAITKRYRERYDLYCKNADVIIKNDRELEYVISRIEKEHIR